MPDKQTDLDKRLSRLYAAPVPESFETGWRADVRREESMERMNTGKRSGGRIFKRLAPALCALVLAAGALWTGAVENSGQSPAVYRASGTPYAASAPRSTNSAKMMTSASVVEEAAYDMVAGEYAAGGQIAAAMTAVPQEGRKLVRTADLTIRTNAFDESLKMVQEQLSAMGGYVEDLYQYGEEVRRIRLSMRVPSEKLDDFLLSLEGAGKVTDRSESAVDRTTEYADNEARLHTLLEKRERLNALMEKAETVEELIEIESAIADTQYQIESYETMQRSIDRQVDLSAVSLHLMEQEQTVVNPELTLAQRIRAGFTASVSGLGNFVRNMIVFVASASPVIALIAAVWLGWKLIRTLINRRK